MNLNKAHQKVQVQKVAYEVAEDFKKITTPRIITSVYAAFLISLHDEFDWGAKRLSRLLEKVDKQYTLINEDYCSIEDIKQVILDETGIDLR